MGDNEILEPNDPATMEYVVNMMNGLTIFTGTDCASYQAMREEMYLETLRLLESPGEKRTVGQMAGFVLGFYNGWRASDNHTVNLLKEMGQRQGWIDKDGHIIPILQNITPH